MMSTHFNNISLKSRIFRKKSNIYKKMNINKIIIRLTKFNIQEKNIL